MNQVRNTHRQSGFTLVELTLSMGFIALLLLGIAMLTLQISAIYTKGLTLRAVNESGQLISSDIQRTLNVSIPAQVLLVGDSTGGRLCANSSVYAWNYASNLADGFNRFESGQARDIRMVRFIGDATFCTPAQQTGAFPALPSSGDSVTELLKAGDNNLAIQSFSVARDSATQQIGSAVEGDDTQRLYAVQFRLGTNDSGAIAASGCEAPESRVDDQYCAVNDFSFTARAGNKEITDENQD